MQRKHECALLKKKCPAIYVYNAHIFHTNISLYYIKFLNQNVNYKFIAMNLLQAKFEESKIKIKNSNYNFRI